MSSEDEDEKFLYSDGEDSQVVVSTEEPASKKQKVDTPNDVETAANDSANEGVSEVSDQDSDSVSDESDSDSDIEIIIGTGNDTSKIDSGKSKISTITGAAPTTTTESNIGAVSDANAATSVPEGSVSLEQQQQQQTIDLNPDAEFDGKPIVQIDPEILKEKPWRQPGANLSDYFNYGFNEQTWMEYLHRQEHLKKEYNPQKILMNLLALQQQGKLNDNGSVPNSQNNPMAMPPPPMGLSPMFGGFPGFPFPGMMNSMQTQNVPNMNNNNNNNSNNKINGNHNDK
ncbi:cleavage polyadenylation factor subunit fip1 [Kluyveromyces marxianus]|nr:cleavage polyadenylation factor subunit fip1 [Kluyveromyces marxianus]KAG0686185.1 cleavage polyadenylation factor subunit fip1 [Kluyveromyces marxianus]